MMSTSLGANSPAIPREIRITHSGDATIYPEVFYDAPQSLQDYITKELKQCGVATPVKVLIFKSIKQTHDLNIVAIYTLNDSEPMHYMWLASYGARELQQYIAPHEQFPQRILVDDDVINSHTDERLIAEQNERIMKHLVDIRHEAGHVYYNDSKAATLLPHYLKRRLLLDLLAGGTLFDNNRSQRLTALFSAEGRNALYSLHRQHWERRADDFAIAHTNNSQELLASAQWFKAQHDELQKTFSNLQVSEWCLRVNHIPPGPRYLKFKAAAERLQAKQAQEAQSARP